MNVDKLMEKLSDNMDKVLSTDGYIRIIDKNNNLIRFDMINQLIIAAQTQDKIFDLKTELEWFSVGRKVIDKSKVINIVVPKYESQYIDTEDGSIITPNELNPLEIKKALKYKIINKENKIVGIYVEDTYDIRNTNIIDESIKYNIPKPEVNIATLIEIALSLTGITVEQCDDMTYYSNSSNHLFIKKESYNEMALAIVKIIAKYMIDCELEDSISKTLDNKETEFTNFEIDLLLESIQFSLMTLFSKGDDSKIREMLDSIEDMKEIRLYEIINILDYFTFSVISLLKFNDNSDIKDSAYVLNRMQKAEYIVDLLSSNIINKKMRGA